jgi:hypothetical protein
MKKEVIIIQKGDDDCDHKELAWIHAYNDNVWHAKSMDMGIDLDSIKEAHGGGKVMVFKDEMGTSRSRNSEKMKTMRCISNMKGMETMR